MLCSPRQASGCAAQVVKGQLELDSDTFEQLKPGLSAYPEDPQAAASSLNTLLETAMKTVPEALQVRTGITAYGHSL